MNSYTLEPVGFIRSTVKGREDAPRQGPEGAPDAWLEIEPQFADAHRVAAATAHLRDRIRSGCIP
jgi:tRNA (Thr-GGU) A37 N-methylase